MGTEFYIVDRRGRRALNVGKSYWLIDYIGVAGMTSDQIVPYDHCDDDEIIAGIIRRWAGTRLFDVLTENGYDDTGCMPWECSMGDATALIPGWSLYRIVVAGGEYTVVPDPDEPYTPWRVVFVLDDE